jgi:hypothetical protein
VTVIKTDAINKDLGSVVNFNKIKKNTSYLDESKHENLCNNSGNGIKTIATVKNLKSENVFRPGIFKNTSGSGGVDHDKSQTQNSIAKKLAFVTAHVKGSIGFKDKRVPVRTTTMGDSGKLAGLVITNGEEAYKKSNTLRNPGLFGKMKKGLSTSSSQLKPRI